MSKNTNLSFLTDYITADITNGRIGINNASPTVAFDVVGVAKFSSSVSATSYNATTQNIFAVDGSEKMRIKSNGNVGIGTTVDIDHKLKVAGIVNSANGASDSVGGGAAYLLDGSATNGSSLTFLQQGVSKFSIWTYDGSNWGNRMSITSGGSVLIGSTTANAVSGSGSLQVSNAIISVGASSFVGFQNRPSTNFFGFYGDTNIIVYNQSIGNIGSFNASNGVYTPLSDINKKKDIELSTIGLNAILELKPTLYRMKTQGDTEAKNLGFIAQEVKQFIPEAYIETGDGEGKFIGLDYQAITSALVKAVQELSTEINLLKQK